MNVRPYIPVRHARVSPRIKAPFADAIQYKQWLTIDLDIKASNLLQEIEDESILVDFEKAEIESPSPQKVYDDRIIYASRKLGLPKSYGHPVLCDFGEARRGDIENQDDIQPEVYRAPEVILEMKWSYSVDIWNVGVMVSGLHISSDTYPLVTLQHGYLRVNPRFLATFPRNPAILPTDR